MSYAKMLVRHRNGLFLAKGHNISPRIFIYNNSQCGKYAERYWNIIDRTTGQGIVPLPDIGKYRTEKQARIAALHVLEYHDDYIKEHDFFKQRYDVAVEQYIELLQEYYKERGETND